MEWSIVWWNAMQWHGVVWCGWWAEDLYDKISARLPVKPKRNGLQYGIPFQKCSTYRVVLFRLIVFGIPLDCAVFRLMFDCMVFRLIVWQKQASAIICCLITDPSVRLLRLLLSGNPRLDRKVVRLQREFRSISTTKFTDPKTGAVTYSYKMGKVRTGRGPRTTGPPELQHVFSFLPFRPVGDPCGQTAWQNKYIGNKKN